MKSTPDTPDRASSPDEAGSAPGATAHQALPEGREVAPGGPRPEGGGAATLMSVVDPDGVGTSSNDKPAPGPAEAAGPAPDEQRPGDAPPARDGQDGSQDGSQDDGPGGSGVGQQDDRQDGAAPAPRTLEALRERLGLDPSDWVLARSVRIYGWVMTALVTALAAVTRLANLSHPHRLMFDETYYVKDAYSIWIKGYEASWAQDPDPAFAAGNFSAMKDEAAVIVHPPLGKWIIGAGIKLFGPESSFGWRFMPALAGILTVLLLARLTMRLTRSPLLAGLAGFFLATDGVGITESRIGLLDIFIGLFGLVSVYCLVRDRQWFRQRLAERMAGSPPGTWAPLV